MTNSNKRNSYILIFCGLILLSLGIFLSVSIGAKDIDFSTMVNSVFGNGNDINSKIIRDVRIPSPVTACSLNMIAVSGAIMQGITRNPIAEPSVIGITQGATFMVAIALVLQQVNTNIVIGGFSLMIFAFIGASISGLFVYFISSRSMGKTDPVKLTLAGTALGTLLISLATGAAMYFNLSQQLSFWINGGFIGVNWEGVKLLFIVGIIGMGCAMLISKRITILSLWEDVAIGLGENTNRTRFIAIVIVILLTGASVSVAGNIIFVGLIIPQIVKKLVGVDFKYIIPCSFVLGSVLIVYSDVISRLINPPYETPIGSLTALLGVPVFIYLIRKEVK